MPPRDPRERPALTEALPVDDVGNGTWRELGEPREVQFGDGSWRHVTALAWWLNRHGQPVVQLLWSSGGTMGGQAYLADPELIREVK
jgi:hypothetical protein